MYKYIPFLYYYIRSEESFMFDLIKSQPFEIPWKKHFRVDFYVHIRFH